MERDLHSQNQGNSEAGGNLAPEVRPWVLLIRETKEGQTVFTQSGPFTTPEVLGQIQAGKAQFTDHVWKAGLDRWVRINELEDFAPEPPNEPETPLAPSEKIDFPMKDAHFQEEIIETVSPVEEKIVEAPVSEPTQSEPLKIVVPESMWVQHRNAILIASAGILLILLWWIVSSQKETQVPVETTPAAVFAPQPEVVEGPPAQSIAPAPPAPVPIRVAAAPSKSKAQIQKEKRLLVDASRSLQRKARLLENQMIVAKKQTRGWSVFYQQWKQDMTAPSQLELRALSRAKGNELAFPGEIKNLAKLRGALLARAQTVDGVIRKGQAKVLSRNGVLEKQFQEFNHKASRL